MKYKIILTRNGEHKKFVNEFRTKKEAFNKFNELKKESESVLLPKKYINYNSITPVHYMMYIVEPKEKDSESRYVRNEMGKLIKEPPLYNEYTILDKFTYNIEETFWVFGYDKVKERKTIKDIRGLLLDDLSKDGKIIRNVITVHNKLIIYDEEHFEMVICKCTEDSQRLQHKLKEMTIDRKMHKKVLFLGTASKRTTSDMYELIKEETGWPLEKIRRMKTKP